MRLDHTDLERFEHLLNVACDDIAVAVSRRFERHEEYLTALESRLSNRIADMEDKIDTLHLNGKFDAF